MSRNSRSSDRLALAGSPAVFNRLTAQSSTTTGYRSSPKHLLSVQVVSVAPSELTASRGPMPPLQSLSLQHSDAYSPDPLVARFGSISSTPLQTPAATLRLGPRPTAPTLRPGPRALGPAIPSAVPSAEVTVHPTWRPPSLPLDIARNNSAADLPTSASYSDHMAVTDEPTPPAAPSVPPSWPSVTSRRRSRGEDASRLHSFHSLSVCELRAELLAERAVTLQELEACVERSDLDALLRAGAARSRRILAAVDAAADAVAEAGVAEAVRAVEAAAAAAAEAEVEAAAALPGQRDIRIETGTSIQTGMAKSTRHNRRPERIQNCTLKKVCQQKI